MVEQVARTRADAIAGFAAVLNALRESAGNPSFREMSGRSRAISHTTLHEAAQGNRLPSWATTVEFVKACGADPADYRERWEQADRAVRSRLPAGGVVPSTEPADRRPLEMPDDAMPQDRSDAPASPPPSPDPAANADDAEPPRATASPRWRRRRFVLPVVALVALAAVAVVVVILSRDSDPPGKKANGGNLPVKSHLTPGDCPLHASNPPAAPPAHAGDASAFIADITLPDCVHIRRGQTVTKVWRLKNVGTVTWKGYSLHRLDLPQERDDCQTISDIPIDDTAPGDLVDIRTAVTAPKKAGFCYARFKMMDAAGHVVFPGSRPVNFQLIVN